MKGFEKLEALLFGADSLSTNSVSSKDAKYWDKKLATIPLEFNNNWSLSYNDQPYNLLKENTDLFLLIHEFRETSFFDIWQGDRCLYYRSEVNWICHNILKDYSESVRGKTNFSTDDIPKRIRWYIFETHKLEDVFKTPFYKKEFPELSLKVSDETAISIGNYFTILFLKISLIILCNIIEIIEKKSNTNWDEDIFFKKLQFKNTSYFIYELFQNHILKRIDEGSPHEIIGLYSTLKSIYYSTRLMKSVYINADDTLKEDILKIENKIFHNRLPEIINQDYDFTKLFGDEDSYNAIYGEIKNMVSEKVYANDRMFMISEKVKLIRDILDDRPNPYNDTLLESIPRRLIQRLDLDYETLKANPELDLKEYDRNRIKPIKTDMSVSDIALLFRTLEEYSIVKVSQKSDLFRTICKVFESKQGNGNPISENSFKNNYNDPDKSSYKFWKEKFKKFYNDFINFN